MRFSQFCICILHSITDAFAGTRQTLHHFRERLSMPSRDCRSKTLLFPWTNASSKPPGNKGISSFRLKPGTYVLRTHHLAYEDAEFSIPHPKTDTVLLRLVPLARELDESVVTHSENRQKISGLSGGRIDLNMEELKSLPKFMGTNDPLKILQLTPGIQTGRGRKFRNIHPGEGNPATT